MGKGSRRDGFKVMLALLGIAAVTLAAYYPGMAAGFYFDDEPNLLDVSALQWDQISWSAVSSALRDAHLRSRPVANISMALNHFFSGLNPAAYHWTNLAIHLAVGLSLLWVIRLLQRRRGDRPGDWGIALLPVLLFLVHPLNIQATTYVVQRMTSLAALFLLLGFGSYLSGRYQPDAVTRRTWYAVAIACFLFAVGSKEIGLLLLPLVLLYEFCFHYSTWLPAYQRVVKRVGLAAVVLAGATVVITVGWLGWVYAGDYVHGAETMPLRDFSGFERVLTQGRVQVFYLTLLLWPAPSRLNLDHDFDVSRSLFDPVTTILAFILIAVTIAVALWSLRTRPALAFPVLGYWLLHSMESGPVNLELVFEHRMYLPMTMIAVLIALNVRPSSASYAVMLVSGAMLAFATYQRNTVWGDPMQFHRDVASKSPEKFRPQYNLGTLLGQQGLFVEAKTVLERAIDLRSDSSIAHNQLGNVYLMTGEPRKAEQYYRQAVENDPENAEALFNLATVLMSQGQYGEQRALLERFIRVAPPYLEEQRQWALRQLGR